MNDRVFPYLRCTWYLLLKNWSNSMWNSWLCWLCHYVSWHIVSQRPNITFFWDMTPFNFEGRFLQNTGIYQTTEHHIPNFNIHCHESLSQRAHTASSVQLFSNMPGCSSVFTQVIWNTTHYWQPYFSVNLKRIWLLTASLLTLFCIYWIVDSFLNLFHCKYNSL